jgi:hypothetical protein
MGREQLRKVSIAATLPGLLVALVATTADGQSFGGRRSADESGVGLGVLVAQPLGEFSHYVDESAGLGAFLHLDIGENGGLGLRFDGSMVYYGSRTATRSFSVGPGFIDYAEVTIRNRIGSFFAGPQITFGSGDVRPYLHLGAGFSYFWTGTDWDDAYYGYASGDLDLDMFFEGETEYSQWTAAWIAGGGVTVRLGGNLNFYCALQYVDNGRVTYLTEGAIVDHGNGYYSFTPVESNANLLFAQFGISIQ